MELAQSEDCRPINSRVLCHVRVLLSFYACRSRKSLEWLIIDASYRRCDRDESGKATCEAPGHVTPRSGKLETVPRTE